MKVTNKVKVILMSSNHKDIFHLHLARICTVRVLQIGGTSVSWISPISLTL